MGLFGDDKDGEHGPIGTLQVIRKYDIQRNQHRNGNVTSTSMVLANTNAKFLAVSAC
jgi:hypothetical protein